MSGRGNIRKVISAVALLWIIVLVGVIGYSYIEGLNFVDALYMTIITVATVGFREVKELSSEGKLFTIGLIIISLGTFAYAVSVITTHLVEGELQRNLRGYKLQSGIKKMKNHVIICGYGRNGRQAVRELQAYHQPFVVVDKKVDVFRDEAAVLHLVEGDASEDEVLIKAGIMRAKALISSLPVDADNLFVSLTARSLNPDILIISRASNASSERKLKAAGANNVVMPERVGGAHMATLVAKPDVVEFLDNLSVHGGAPTNLEQISCDCLSPMNQGKTIAQLGIRSASGANIIGFRTPGGEFVINPGPDTVVLPDTRFFVLGTPSQIAHMRKILKGS